MEKNMQAWRVEMIWFLSYETAKSEHIKTAPKIKL